MRHSSDPSVSIASLTAATVFSRLSRRRHIDLQRFTSCLCRA
ncbi:putative leader peptide [Streptomyces sp. N50]|nr:putative leader peptide [Streptomyces sp. N50]WOX15258.1 putative leader peptide [Streptomyces sp. N50]